MSWYVCLAAESAGGPIKPFRAENPALGIRKLQAGSRVKLEIVARRQFSSRGEARDAIAELRRRLASRRLDFGWFDYSAEDALAVLERISTPT